MKLGFHGATIMTSALQTDVAASQKFGGSQVNVAVFFEYLRNRLHMGDYPCLVQSLL